MTIRLETINKQQLVDYHKKLLTDMATPRRVFVVFNDLTDPETGELIFPLVDDGRPSVSAKNKKALSFLISPTTRFFGQTVAASRPRRITEQAQLEVRNAMEKTFRRMVELAAQQKRFVTSADLDIATEAVKKEVVAIYVDTTVRSVTGENFERETHLKDHFKTRDEG
jgi:hypothetical protein